MSNRIVAAIDSSPASHAALQWAFEYATTIGADLLAVHIIDLPQWPLAPGSGDSVIERVAEVNQLRVLSALPGVSDAECPVRVTISAPHGPLVRSLAESSRDAVLVVVGEPQTPEHAGLPEQLAAECWCDVVAVSGDSAVRHVSSQFATVRP
jgi:nucleotide-binding universal stress UspA family protein